MENKYKRIVRGAMLAVGMLVASVSVWGQEIGDERTLISDITSFWPSNSGYGKSIVNSTDSRALGGGREIVYATSNSSVSLQIQQGGSADNLDGYIRWYVVNNESDITNISVQSVGNLQMPTINNDNAAYEKILQFSNGIAWLRGTHDETYQEYGRRGWQNTGSANDVDDVSPGEICSMSYRIPNNFSTDDEIIVVCEASSLNNVEGQANDNTWTAPMVTFRHVFVIRPASERSNELETMKNNLLNQESGYRGWTSNESVFLRLVAADKSNLFLESYDIHTPLKQGEDLSASEIGTNYRLSEDISNYYVQTTSGRSVQANQVMWRVFNESGEQVTTQTTTGNIWDKSFGTSEGINVDGNETQILYLVAEVSREGGQYPSDGRFPAAFFTIYLEPYTEPLTEGGLASHASDDNYSLRDEDFLERNNYVEVASIQFEETNDVVSMEQMMQNKTLNYAAQPMENANSYYAYAYPGQFQNRRNNRFSVGRGEYGLYRTLNYQQNNNSLSKGDVTINGRTGVYNDWFASNSGVYNKYIFDRTYDRTGEYGYFFYLDATDDPGVITNITLPSSLCPDTRLVVTAWVCDMAHTRTATHADIGITFKGISDNGEETILNRFYSGKIMNKPTEWGANSTYGQAEWQQLYFTFTYQDLGYKSYVLEISNNCPNSDGADYAVDDIKLWRSTPDIRVQRLDACDASTLTISSDYQTILNNMDWTEGQTIDVSGSKNNALAKYRLGFHGARDADGYPQNVNSSYVGNTYFAFIEGLKEDRDGTITAGSDITPYNNPNDPLNPLVITDKGTQHRWVNVNKGLKVDVPISRYSFRVAVSTNAHTGGVSSDPDHWPTTPEDAIRAEKVLNLRAVQDYNYAVENLDNVFGYTPDVDPETNQATAIDLQGLTEENVYLPENEDTYLEVAQELYERLKIPRIRSPWVEESTGMIHLYTMDVTNTDLKFDGELVGYDNNNDPIYADGQYHVILLGAQEVNSWEDSSWEGGSTEPINLEQGCLMMSSFTVYGSVVIRVTTTTDADALVCAGSQRKVSATLVSTEGRRAVG